MSELLRKVYISARAADIEVVTDSSLFEAALDFLEVDDFVASRSAQALVVNQHNIVGKRVDLAHLRLRLPVASRLAKLVVCTATGDISINCDSPVDNFGLMAGELSASIAGVGNIMVANVDVLGSARLDPGFGDTFVTNSCADPWLIPHTFDQITADDTVQGRVVHLDR
jgi:hypothetical protein